METKYYTPKIEEFHVGFEFEYYDGNKWEKEVSSIIYSDQSYVCIPIPEKDYGYDSENTRVKHLDRSDIESLGWELYSQGNVNYFTFRIKKDGNIQMGVSFGKPSKIDFSTNDGLETIKFYIKNKSELKRLMFQLNILKDE